MGRIIDINKTAEQLLKQYRDIPSLDKSQKLLVEKYGEKHFVAIRKRFAQLWLKQNGINVLPAEKSQKKITDKVGKKIATKHPQLKVKSSSKKRTVMFPGRVVPVPKEMQSSKGSKVVTKWVDPESNIPPIHISLPVLRTMEIGGHLCYVVKYGPKGVEPYEWHIPVINKFYADAKEIHCIYYKSSLIIDNRSKACEIYKIGNVYDFLVLSIRQCLDKYLIECYDQKGSLHEVYSESYINVGLKVRCKLKAITTSADGKQTFDLFLVKEPIRKPQFTHKENASKYRRRKDSDERSGYVHFVLTPMGNKR